MHAILWQRLKCAECFPSPRPSPRPQVHVLAAVCQKGTLLLVPGCLRVLGGGVESMAAANSLESVLNRAMSVGREGWRHAQGEGREGESTMLRGRGGRGEHHAQGKR